MNNRATWGLAAILLLAAGLRLWNFDFNNPHTGRISGGDDEFKIRQSLRVVRHDLAPAGFRQPYYLIYTSGFLIKQLLPHDQRGYGRVWRLTARSMICYSVLTVFLTYWLARRVTGDPRTALLAALLLAVVPIDVIGSRYFKEDVPLMFFTTLSLLTMASLVVTRRPIFYLLSGITIGTAIAVKYVGVLLIAVLVVAHVLYVRQVPPELRRGARLPPRLAAALLLTVALFLIFNPYDLVEWRHFLEGVTYQAGQIETGHGDGTVLGLRSHFGFFGLLFGLLPGLTIPVLAASLLGIVLAARSRRPGWILLLAAVGLWYFAVECEHAKPWPFFARYLQPIVPCLCAFAAAGLMSAWMWLVRRPGGRLAGVALFTLCVAMPLTRSAMINVSLGNETREQAAVWMREHLPADSRVYVVRPQGPVILRDRGKLLLSEGPLLSPDELRSTGIDYVAMSGLYYDRYAHMGPDSSPRALAAKATLAAIHSEFDLVCEIRPAHPWQAYGFHNPVVRVYRVTPDSANAPPPPAEVGELDTNSVSQNTLSTF